MTDTPKFADAADLIGFDPDDPPEGLRVSWKVWVYADNGMLHNPHGPAWVDNLKVSYYLEGEQITTAEHAEATKPPPPKLEDFGVRYMHDRGCGVGRVVFAPLDGPSPYNELCTCGLREAWLAAKEGDDQ